jgi:hypothetical protein
MGHNLEPDPTIEEAISRASEKEPGLEGVEPDGSPGVDASTNGKPIPSSKAVIATVEAANLTTIGLMAKYKGLGGDEVKQLCRFTEEERDMLEPFAPAAAPYLKEAAEYSEVVMAFAFAGLSGFIILQHWWALETIYKNQRGPVGREPGEIAPPVDVAEQAWKAGEPTNPSRPS